jgi:hypothetical protein
MKALNNNKAKMPTAKSPMVIAAFCKGLGQSFLQRLPLLIWASSSRKQSLWHLIS